MRQLIDSRHQLHVDVLWNVGLPVVGGTRKQHNTEEEVRQHGAYR